MIAQHSKILANKPEKGDWFTFVYLDRHVFHMHDCESNHFIIIAKNAKFKENWGGGEI